jgi:hypothetical protein
MSVEMHVERKAVAADFDIDVAILAGAEILVHYYSYEDYSGEAFVLFRRDGKLYEVNGSHCSCCGLEGQWGPEETDVKSLLHRVCEGYPGLGSSYRWSNDDNITTARADKFRRKLLNVLYRLDRATWLSFAPLRPAEFIEVLEGVTE